MKTPYKILTGFLPLAVVMTAATASAQQSAVRISEVLYRSSSIDYDVFLELSGPAATDLTGLTLVGVNGNGGSEFNTIALTGTIPSDGVYVIVHPNANRHTHTAAGPPTQRGIGNTGQACRVTQCIVPRDRVGDR